MLTRLHRCAPAAAVEPDGGPPDSWYDHVPAAQGGRPVAQVPIACLEYLQLMVLSRGWAAFLIGVGVWTWVIWPRFAVAIWNDPRAWSTGDVGQGTPTGFLWVHAVLIVASLAIGSAVGLLGVLGFRRRYRKQRDQAQEEPRR